MATTLLDFLYAVRYVNSVAARRAILYALTCVMKSVTPIVFAQGIDYICSILICNECSILFFVTL